MSRPRTFDWDEAARRHAHGESISALAASFGVADSTMRRAVDPAYRATSNATQRNRCVPCAGGCGVLVWDQGGRTGLCKKCHGLSRRTDTHGTEGRHKLCKCETCRTAASKARRERRHRSRVPCSHGCGTMVDTQGRRWPDKPPECLPCAMARIHGKQAA